LNPENQAASAAPALSVVIPHFRQPEALARALASLASQRDASPFEVIVVDNASGEMPTDECMAYDNVRLLLEETKGPGPARSTGAAAAKAPIIAFLDADCVADPDWISIILACFREHPDAHVLGGDVRILPVDPRAYTAIEAYEELYGYRQRLFVERDHYSATCNMAVRAEVFRAVGPFGGLSLAEDMEWGRRATDCGYRTVFIPEMRVATPARQTFAELARKYDRHVGHDFAPVAGRPVALVKWLAKTAAMPFSPLAEVANVLSNKRLPPGLGLRLRAFCCLTRTRLWRAKRMAQLLMGRDADALAAGWRKPAE
jgi:cellulose synthase/poly-beta-1,6-N-acetylglucosamine synthase-like glycosyltransferase